MKTSTLRPLNNTCGHTNFKKQKMKRRIVFLMLLPLLMFVTNSCNKTAVENKNSIDNLKAPDGFTFNTTHSVSVSLEMPASINFSKYRSRFNIYTAAPDDGGKLIYSGSFNTLGHFKGSVKIPASLKSIYVSTIAGAKTIAIENNSFKEGGVTVNFGEGYGSLPPDSISTQKNIENNTTFNKTTYSQSFSNTNVIGNGDFETNDFGYINWWNSPHPVDNRWYITTHYAPGEWFDESGNHVVRTPYTNGRYAGGFSQMISVNPDDIVTFSCDIKATTNANGLRSWLFLIPKDASGNAITYIEYEYTPPPTTWTTKQIVGTMPTGTVTCQVLMWAHDLIANQSVMFDNVVVTISGNDTDGDGVDDDNDDYPNDPDRAFNVYYPNETDWGTLAYEDLWPGTGDYDFNDLILDYHFKSVLNAQNELVEFFTDYSVRAVGASLANGFGFMLDGDPSNVASVTGTNISENYINLNANGTEQGQSNTVIIVFDNAFNMINPSGSTFINTKPDVPYVDPDTNQLHVLYNNPLASNITGSAPYNPFLILNKTRGQEVHLAGYPPTNLADQSLFGTWADDSNPVTGKYYQTVNNLPWALDLPVSFDYPVEQVEIINAYNHFVEWAESGGSVYTDWYEDNTGYRVDENIYAPPTTK